MSSSNWKYNVEDYAKTDNPFAMSEYELWQSYKKAVKCMELEGKSIEQVPGFKTKKRYTVSIGWSPLVWEHTVYHEGFCLEAVDGSEKIWYELDGQAEVSLHLDKQRILGPTKHSDRQSGKAITYSYIASNDWLGHFIRNKNKYAVKKPETPKHKFNKVTSTKELFENRKTLYGGIQRGLHAIPGKEPKHVIYVSPQDILFFNIQYVCHRKHYEVWRANCQHYTKEFLRTFCNLESPTQMENFKKGVNATKDAMLAGALVGGAVGTAAALGKLLFQAAFQ